jgi:FkbM family methyltransferase
MMTLSYAQAMEDWHLALAFAGEPPGFYVDVGGGHPVADNVTFDLYLRGWRGLVVEPQDRLAQMYARVRPRDRVETCLVGDRDGSASFHQVEGLHGLSGMADQSAELGRAMGAKVTRTERPIRRLASLMHQFARSRVDVLKIDVEGAEEAVLRGMDWTMALPRLVLVEAVRAGDMAPSHGDWEPGLLSLGYSLALFDGLNRWYVAPDAAALGARLPAGQSPWDAVAHLWDLGRAEETPRHPDHMLARLLAESGRFAAATTGAEPLGAILVEVVPQAERLSDPLQKEDAGRLLRLVVGDAAILGQLPPLPELAGMRLADAVRRLADTDAARAAIGRIAARHDGGFVD